MTPYRTIDTAAAPRPVCLVNECLRCKYAAEATAAAAAAAAADISVACKRCGLASHVGSRRKDARKSGNTYINY